MRENQELKELRDKRLIETFYLLYDLKRIRLDDVLTQMSREMFFLSESYIYKLIFYNNKNLLYYNLIKEQQRKVSALRLIK